MEQLFALFSSEEMARLAVVREALLADPKAFEVSASAELEG